MKRIIWVIVLIVLGSDLIAQQVESSDKETLQIKSSSSNQQQPYYVIIAGNKQNRIDGNQYSAEDNPIANIDTDWIEKVSVYKGDEAISRYGDDGENGVVVIEINEAKVKQLPADLRKGFKRIK